MRRALMSWGVALLVIAAGVAAAQIEVEALPDDVVRKAAMRLGEMVAKAFPDPALKIVGGAEKAVGYRGEGVIVIMLPDRGFTSKTIEEAGAQAAPVGWIALRGLAPVVQGKTIPLSGLATVQPDGNGKEVAVLFLGVRKEGENRVLDLYSRGAKPLYQARLTHKEAGNTAPRPLEAKFANLDRAAMQVDLVVALGGTYQATLRMGEAE